MKPEKGLPRLVNEFPLPPNQPKNDLASHLMYSSYSANRGYGMTMEQLKSIGFKDAERMEEMYLASDEKKRHDNYNRLISDLDKIQDSDVIL